jgi:hypothetical protein
MLSIGVYNHLLTNAFALQPSLSAARTRLMPADHPSTSIRIHRPSNERCDVGWVYAYIAGVSCLRRTAVFLEGDAAQRILTSQRFVV